MLNIRKLAQDYSLKQEDLADLLSCSQSVISTYYNAGRPISRKHMRILVEHFTQSVLDKYEVTTEEFFAQPRYNISTGNVGGNVVAGNNNRVGVPTPKREDVELIDEDEPQLKETVILGPEIINQPGLDIRQELKKDNLPVVTKYTQDIVPLHDAKVYLENDEMSPEIEANDPVLIRFFDSTSVVPGRMYFVDLYRGGVVRWVFPQEDGSLVLRSTNTPDMNVPLDSVKSISEVVAIWKRPKSMPIEHITMQASLEHRDHQIDELLSQQGRLIGIIEDQLK